MKKKLAIIGRGTAGSIAVSHFLSHTDWEVEWCYDSSIPTQSVGEGSTLQLPWLLYHNLGIHHHDVVARLKGSMKYGIRKIAWTPNGDFIDNFVPASVGYHFTATELQNLVLELVKHKVKLIDARVSADQLDADFVMDCTGAPREFSQHQLVDSIPVNAAYISQCPWKMSEFSYTLTWARSWGWVFGIPLQDRCSVGYMYNASLTDIETVKEDVKEVLAHFNLTPNQTRTLEFRNYYHRNNFQGRVAYNGNASFFLEPLGATSIASMDFINRLAYDVWTGASTEEESNARYLAKIQEMEELICLHYLCKSYPTEFWSQAYHKAVPIIRRGMAGKLGQFVRTAHQMTGWELDDLGDHGVWPTVIYKQNLKHLGLFDEMLGIGRRE